MGVLLAEIGSLFAWIVLKGLAAGESRPGIVLRSLVSATLLGFVARAIARRTFGERPGSDRGELDVRGNVAVSVAVVVGLALGRTWAGVGGDYFSNVLGWMQSSSTLALVGGLRGLGTRLTLWLALLGASIATAKGKHINVDAVMRFVAPTIRVPLAVVTWASAALVCATASVAFVDHIAVEGFKAPAFRQCPDDPRELCDLPASSKASHVATALAHDAFLLGRQISLDLKSAPKILVGTRYASWLHAPEWNAWIRDGGWTAHFGPEAVDGLLMPEAMTESRAPFVSVPGGTESAAGILVREANFIFPFGLLVLALRFLLRALLAISGHVKVDPDAAHGDEDDPRRDVGTPEGEAAE
ncbi:MAG: TRAP transporter small permease subunit [Polyangiaceae bacterium]